MTHYVVGFMFSPAGSAVALILKRQPAWMKFKYNGIGGKIADGEEPVAAMVREFTEEAGLQTIAEDWEPFCMMQCPEAVVHCFKAFNSNVWKVRTMEREEVSFFDMDDLPPNLMPNLRWLLPMALHEFGDVRVSLS